MIPLVINPGGELQTRPLKEVIRIIRVRSEIIKSGQAPGRYGRPINVYKAVS